MLQVCLCCEVQTPHASIIRSQRVILLRLSLSLSLLSQAPYNDLSTTTQQRWPLIQIVLLASIVFVLPCFFLFRCFVALR
jgi:hypothetical protein